MLASESEKVVKNLFWSCLNILVATKFIVEHIFAYSSLQNSRETKRRNGIAKLDAIFMDFQMIGVSYTNQSMDLYLSICAS